MAPEYGATTGYFAIDSRTLDYLRETGRDAAQVGARRGLCPAHRPVVRPGGPTTLHAARSRSTSSSIGMHIAGPRRPQDLLQYSEARSTLAALAFEPGSAHPFLPRHPIAIAAITSCTNTSDPALLVAAGLVARKAPAIRPPRPDLGQDVARPRVAGGRRLSAARRARPTTCRPSASTSSASAARPASATPVPCPTSIRAARSAGRSTRSRCSPATATSPAVFIPTWTWAS